METNTITLDNAIAKAILVSGLPDNEGTRKYFKAMGIQGMIKFINDAETGKLAQSAKQAPKPPSTPRKALADMTPEEMRAELEQRRAGGTGKLSFKVSEKGALSIYGVGRFPTTLYRGQWERILNAADEIKTFIKANESSLATKD